MTGILKKLVEDPIGMETLLNFIVTYLLLLIPHLTCNCCKIIHASCVLIILQKIGMIYFKNEKIKQSRSST